MSLTLELPADVLADLDAEAASHGTSPESIVTTVLRNHFSVAKNTASTFVKDVSEDRTQEAVVARFTDDLAWEVAWWNSLSDTEREEYNEREREAFEAAGAESLSGYSGRTSQEVAARIRTRYAAEHGRK
jgi:plasmid stability protein